MNENIKNLRELCNIGKSGKPDSAYDTEQLKKGVEVEKEHTDDEETAKKIAKDHLDECPTYYDKLQDMEKDCKKDESDILDRIRNGMYGKGQITQPEKGRSGKIYPAGTVVKIDNWYPNFCVVSTMDGDHFTVDRENIQKLRETLEVKNLCKTIKEAGFFDKVKDVVGKGLTKAGGSLAGGAVSALGRGIPGVGSFADDVGKSISRGVADAVNKINPDSYDSYVRTRQYNRYFYNGYDIDNEKDFTPSERSKIKNIVKPSFERLGHKVAFLRTNDQRDYIIAIYKGKNNEPVKDPKTNRAKEFVIPHGVFTGIKNINVDNIIKNLLIQYKI